MMRKIFLDTSGILALVNKGDRLYPLAKGTVDLLISEGCKFFITDFILVEIGNALSKNKKLGSTTLRLLLNSPNISRLNLEQINIDEAIDIYEKYSDKTWGLTDITSFVIMKEFSISDAFTCDIHFEQFGFNILLK